jgi:hypothetical protein
MQSASQSQLLSCQQSANLPIIIVIIIIIVSSSSINQSIYQYAQLNIMSHSSMTDPILG